MAKSPVLQTARLRLVPYETAHLDAMAEMFGDPEVTAFTYLGRQDRAGTAKVLGSYMAFLAERGFGMFAILDKQSGAYLGEAGLFVPPAVASTEFLALRYALNRVAWGKGFATEASTAVLDDAFGRLGQEAVIAGVVADNLPSIRVIARIGFVRSGEATSGPHTYDVFTLTRAAWLARATTG